MTWLFASAEFLRIAAEGYYGSRTLVDRVEKYLKNGYVSANVSARIDMHT
jgi:hypothetical protein